jgi:hypothetical protein
VFFKSAAQRGKATVLLWKISRKRNKQSKTIEVVAVVIEIRKLMLRSGTRKLLSLADKLQLMHIEEIGFLYTLAKPFTISQNVVII